MASVIKFDTWQNTNGEVIADTAGGARLPLSGNAIINGDFGVWQRGTSESGALADGLYLADRWKNLWTGAGNPTNVTVSRESFTPGELDVNGFGEPEFYQKMVITTVGSSTGYRIEHDVEDVRTFAGQAVTASFWLKADEAHSLTLETVQFFGSGGSTAVANSFSLSQSTTPTSWTRITATANVPSVSGKTIGTGSKLVLRFDFGTDADGDEVSIWGVQLEAGSVATPFRLAGGGSKAAELALCQRYYYRNTPGLAYSNHAQGIGQSSSVVSFLVPLPTTMRTAVSSVDYANLNIELPGVAVYSFSSLALATQALGINMVKIFTSGSSGLTTARPYYLASNNSTDAYIGFSAEL